MRRNAGSKRKQYKGEWVFGTSFEGQLEFFGGFDEPLVYDVSLPCVQLSFVAWPYQEVRSVTP